MRYNVYIWGFSYLDYSFDALVSWSHKLSFYSWFCSHSVLSVLLILCCFLSLGDNSGCMNSRYGDVWYMVCIWGFSCLNYFFDVIISQIHNLSLYNWFCHIYLMPLACSCEFMLTTRFSINAFPFEFIDTCVLVYASHLTLILSHIG